MARRTLDSITIDGFKSIQHAEVGLSGLNVLVGPNGAGKSNFVSAFGLLGAIVRGRLQVTVAESGGAAPLFFGGPDSTSRIRLYTNFGSNGYEVELGYGASDQLFFASEECTFHDRRYDRPYVEGLPGGMPESQMPEAARSRRVVRYCYEIISDWTAYHFHDTSRTSGLKRKQKLDDNASLRENASNLAPFLYRLRETHPASYKRIVRTVRLVAPFFDDFVLAPDRLNADMIQLEWRHAESDAYFNAQSLSDGSLRFMCLATLLLQPDPPSVIVIDEPELGLHPFAITQLADLFRSAAGTGHQMIVSTQSVTLLNNLEPQDVVVTEQVKGETTFDRLDPDELDAWLKNYSVGEMWEKNLLGGRPS